MTGKRGKMPRQLRLLWIARPCSTRRIQSDRGWAKSSLVVSCIQWNFGAPDFEDYLARTGCSFIEAVVVNLPELPGERLLLHRRMAWAIANASRATW